MSIRRFVLSAVAALMVVAPLASAQSLTTKRIVSGLSSPVFVTQAPGDFDRLFIVQQGSAGTALIRIFKYSTNSVNAAPFLTIGGILTGGERGLLGLAFHPDYKNNGFFYVGLTAPGGAFGQGMNTVRRYKVTNDPDIADPGATTIIQVDDPFSNHNGGWVGFGPDGYLYVAMGDGGSANDPGGRAQDITDMLLGKILRLDVNSDDFPGDPNKFYHIPRNNPFVGKTGDDEIWTVGMRNPWRNSFDRLTGDFWTGDVGQNAWEEIDFQPASSAGGLNYGWRCMEGLACTGLSGCTCNAPELTLPIHVYAHTSNPCDSTTGGYVYRGCAIPDLEGTYFFADYCREQIWSLRYVNGQVLEFQERTAELAPGGGLSIDAISSFGEDNYGEMYICDAGGEIFKIVPKEFVGPDCNGNGQRDECDILGGLSKDDNANGIPDECEEECYADCDGSGELDVDDFICFQTLYGLGDLGADCDGSGELDVDDFICYQTEYGIGCG